MHRPHPHGSKGIRDRAFGRYGVATVVLQILLMVDGFDVDGSAELTLLDVNIDIQEGDMGLGGVPGDVDRIATVEPLKEGDRESGPCGQSKNMSSINLSQRLGL